jgi:hypothetical protein
VLGYFASALVVDGLFRGASFCKYVCPIGQFQFLGATLSPLEVKVREPLVCGSCSTRDCIRGNAAQRGCELELFAPAKVGNLDCTACLDCVRACPHDNIGLLPALPARELTADGPRSSLGRLPRRLDLAALALLVVAGAFVNAAGMLAPVTAAVDDLALRLGSKPWAQTILLVIGLVLVPAAALALCGLLSRSFGHAGRSWRELATRFSLSLLPLGFAMWTAHFVFHLGTGFGTLVPVVQRIAQQAGSRALGDPDWRMSHPAAAHGPLLGIEILLLDLGLLLSLYTALGIARRITAGRRRPLATLLPFALLATALWLLGLWILVQPMEMRGMLLHG